MPGTAALNNEGQADVTSVSCAAPGNCVAGGEYQNSRTGQPAFIVEETNGSWGKATEVPGMARLDRHDSSLVTSVSCPTPGNCAAAGGYYDPDYQQAFVVDETNGTWGDAIEVPGTAALNTAGDAVVNSISCSTPGNCVAGGYFSQPGPSNLNQPFLVEEKNGRWGNAIEVPGTAALNSGGNGGVDSVSCATPGNCSAGGSVAPGDSQYAFVIDERNGRWGTARVIRGEGDAPGVAGVYSISCAAAGSCAAAIGADNEAFVADETNGVWGNAIPVPGTRGIASYMYEISCTAPSNCTAGGQSNRRAFVADEKNGRWGRAVDVPGLAGTRSRGRDSSVTSISCVTSGYCAAGGFYGPGEVSRVFVVDKTRGMWGTAIQVPGSAALNSGENASLNAISCAAAGRCVAGGSYTAWDKASDDQSVQAFLVSSPRRPSR